MTALVVVGVVFTLLMFGAGINEILTKMFNARVAYGGMLAGSLAFTILLTRRRRA
jgi:hypothetical protein